MTLAVVTTRMGDKTIVVTLEDAGWSDPDAPTIARILDLEANPDSIDPAYGDPNEEDCIRTAYTRGRRSRQPSLHFEYDSLN